MLSGVKQARSLGAFSSLRRSAPGGPRGCRRPASRAVVCVSTLRPLVIHTVFQAFLCCTHHLRVVGRVDAGAVKEEAHAGEGLALTVAEGIHELLQLGCALDLEEDLVVVVGHLDVEVLGLLGSLVLVAGRGRRRRRRHGVGVVRVVFGRADLIFIGEGAQVSQAGETVLRWGMSAKG